MRYLLREKIIAVRDVFTIADENDEPVYTITSKILALRQSFLMEDMEGNNLGVIKRKWIAITPRYAIKIKDGSRATIRRAYFRFHFGPRFIIKSSIGRIVAAGNFLAREFDFEMNGEKIAETSRHWVTMTDTYGIDIHDEAHAKLILCAVVAIDAFAARSEALEAKKSGSSNSDM